MSQFRQIMVTTPCNLKLRNESLLIKTTDSVQELALNQLDVLVLDTQQCIFSESLLVALQKYNVSLVLTDKHHQPVLKSYRTNVENQTEWSFVRKQQLWQVIVKQKINNQHNILSKYGLTTKVVPTNSIEDPDEAAYAKFYFNKLFGDEFTRNFGADNINSQLNYGYSILTNYLTTRLVAHNYLPEIGIHHRSNENQQNLACDLVEPIRFIIDDFVYKHRNSNFDRLLREELVDLLNIPVIYDGKSYETLSNAMNTYVINCLKMLNGDVPINNKKVKVEVDANAAISHV